MTECKCLPRVAILMSTYNGEKYLRDQINSIYSQQGVIVKLYVRDDGSTDKTLEILKEYPDIALTIGDNIGCEASFMSLLNLNIDADYFAFSDQDDVWLPDKLITAIQNIHENECDLYVCNLELVDSSLKQLKILFTEAELSFWDTRMKDYIVCNLHGCVQVWTAKLQSILQSYTPDVTVPHDVWVNAVANMVSSTFIDKTPHIYYRMHSSNSSGYATSRISRIKKAYRFYVGEKHYPLDTICMHLLRGYSIYVNDKNKLKILELIANYNKSIYHRIKLFVNGFVWNNPLRYKLLYGFCVVIKKL